MRPTKKKHNFNRLMSPKHIAFLVVKTQRLQSLRLYVGGILATYGLSILGVLKYVDISAISLLQNYRRRLTLAFWLCLLAV